MRTGAHAARARRLGAVTPRLWDGPGGAHRSARHRDRGLEDGRRSAGAGGGLAGGRERWHRTHRRPASRSGPGDRCPCAGPGRGGQPGGGTGPGVGRGDPSGPPRGGRRFVALLDRRGVRGARRRAPDGPHRRERGRRPRTDRHGAGGSGRAGSAPAALRRRRRRPTRWPASWRGWPRP